MPLRDVPDHAAADRVMPVAPAEPSAALAKTPAKAAAHRHRAAKNAQKFVWAQAGALLGLAIGAADVLFAWRGTVFETWENAAGLGYDFDHVCGTVVLTSFLAFVAGAIFDAVNPARRRNVRPRKTPPETSLFTADIMARHWRGDLPLWVSGWVFGVIGSIVVSFVPAIASAVFTADRIHNPALVFSESAAVAIMVFAVAVWQSVGVWRSAARYAAAPPRHDHDEADLAFLWSALARLAVIIGLASLVGTFWTEWLPQLGELYKIAFYDDPDIPSYSIRLSRDGAEAEIVGGFKYGLADEFAALVKQAHRLKVVRLDSAGGRLGEGEKLFRLIRERGLATYVSSKCFSACTLAFAGGRERYLKRGAVLGFHRAEFPGVSENEFDDLQHKVFEAAGFDGRFIKMALSTPHRDLWTPSPDVLLAAGVITGLTDGAKNGRFFPG